MLYTTYGDKTLITALRKPYSRLASYIMPRFYILES